MKETKRKWRWLLAGLWVLLLMAPGRAQEQEQPLLGDKSDGSRALPVHRIRLYDEEGVAIHPDDQPLLPFSTRYTCGKCHNYEIIRGGWHFNAHDPAVDPGRPSEPWILNDAFSATQLPLSYRGWPGTFRPQALGLSTMDFLDRFGRHFPGGGIGELDSLKSAENYMRWWVSGNLEINCLACHDADRSQDQAEFAAQIQRQNYRWAIAAASELASVTGSARNMPVNYDIYIGSALDDPLKAPPAIEYDRSRFNKKAEVFFDIKRRMPNEKCYNCHSSHAAGQERWQTDGDIHLAGGMLCVDCHRNGLDHAMTRGYENEPAAATNPAVAALTCRGCHLGDAAAGETAAGRLGAPVPEHRGLPPVHFEALSCTACHSGPVPKEHTGLVKTSRAHALGTHRVDKSADARPGIEAPIFKKRADGKIAPHYLLWPSYWGYLDGNRIAPVRPETVWPFLQELFAGDTTLVPGKWPNFTDAQVVTVLDSLAAQDTTREASVFVSGGWLYEKSATGTLARRAHPAAQPYAWALAHDVRPAKQALGAKGCGDCHATDAPLYFGKIPRLTPLQTAQDETARMTAFLEVNAAGAWLFASSFLFRPVLKAIVFFSALAILLTVLVYGMQGFIRLLKTFGADH